MVTSTHSPTTECGAKPELLTTLSALELIPTEIGTPLLAPPESPEILALISIPDPTLSPVRFYSLVE